jgi:hypothetical protein
VPDVEELKDPGYHVDINDPRNSDILTKLKELKTRKLKDHLLRDSYFPLYDIESIRLRLLRLRQLNPDLAATSIPILIEEIYKHETKFFKYINEHEMENFILEKGAVFNEGIVFADRAGEVPDELPMV